ncbi:hypothetical protein ACFLZ8_04805 [Planctomycetota bacterium]
MYSRNVVLFGIILPSVWLGVFIIGILISFVDSRISSAIEFEGLILLTILIWPVIYIIGSVVSVIALIKSGLKIDALYAFCLNIVLLLAWFLVKNSFLLEFELIN